MLERYASQVERTSVTDEIIRRLRRSDAPVRAISLFYDEDLDTQAVWVMYALPQPSGDTWPLEETDRYCETVNDLLGDLVGFAYCDFRDESEAEEAMRTERAFGWIDLKQDQPAA